MAQKRLDKELRDLRSKDLAFVQELNVSEDNLLVWEALLLPENPPYNKYAFKIAIKFPRDYPFKPFDLEFITKIYHPNITENGRICCCLLHPNDWSPAKTVEKVLQGLIVLLKEPNIDHPLRGNVAKEYKEEREKFMHKAEKFCEKHALIRS